MDDLRPGERFAGCRIEAVAGRGGMGIVYRATELALDRRVALKVVAPEGVADSAYTERFVREVRMAASIDHPNIVPVYGTGEEAGRLYLVMRYVDGTDLHALVRRDGPLAPARAARIVAQIAAGLDAAHGAGLVHRDVKPANVLVTSAGAAPGHDHVYLTDFGLTVEVSSDTRMTTSGQWIGSVDYMAPEQLRAEPVDARTDVYALGGVLHAALTGDAPFRRQTVPQTIAAHLGDRPPRPSAMAGVDEIFDAVVARALAKDPADRYSSAGDLGRAALAAATGERLTIPERIVARGRAAPSEDPTGRLPLPTPRAATRIAPTRADELGGPPLDPAPNGAGGRRAVRRLRPIPPVAGPAPSPDPAEGNLWSGGGEAAARARPASPGDAAARPGSSSPRAARGSAASPPAGAPAAEGSATSPPAAAPAAGGSAASPPPAPSAAAGGRDPAGSPPAAATVHRGRRGVRPLALLFVLLAAVAGLAAVVATRGDGARRVSASLTEDEVRAAAQDFADAYGAEDVAALRSTLARNVQRVAPDGSTEGREAVLAIYRRQFATSDVDAYELGDLQVVRGAAGRAAGSYTVKRSGREDLKGRVAFGVVREDGQPRIALIATQAE